MPHLDAWRALRSSMIPCQNRRLGFISLGKFWINQSIAEMGHHSGHHGINWRKASRKQLKGACAAEAGCHFHGILWFVESVWSVVQWESISVSCPFVVCFEALDDDEGTKNGDLIVEQSRSRDVENIFWTCLKHFKKETTTFSFILLHTFHVLPQ